MPNVSFEGFSFELQNYLGVMDIFAYPSNYEGLGSVLLDAMHAALPIVASRVGGIPEIISHEHNGLLVEPGNAQALADALLRLYQDAGLRARLAERAQQRAAGHTPAAMARQYAEIYASLGVHPTL
jgi:glycosyltransferase involved in cell wall biosynthesis